MGQAAWILPVTKVSWKLTEKKILQYNFISLASNLKAELQFRVLNCCQIAFGTVACPETSFYMVSLEFYSAQTSGTFLTSIVGKKGKKKSLLIEYSPVIKWHKW